MALGDGIRRNIASVDAAERTLLRDALVELNHRLFSGSKSDAVPGGVSHWFKMDEIHQATHVHHGPEFVPWHRELVNYMESELRSINSLLSMHYWDWTQDPRDPFGDGSVNLFTSAFMGNATGDVGDPWLSAGFYNPITADHRDATGNPADPPNSITRNCVGNKHPLSVDTGIVNAADFPSMRLLMESAHDTAHGFIGGTLNFPHISFRDPIVFLLHSNVDRLYAKWQTQAGHPQRVDPALVYGAESGDAGLNGNVEPWSTGHTFDTFNVEHFIRPWYAPENLGNPHTYKHASVVFPPCYDTNGTAIPLAQVINVGTPPVINFNDVPTGETTVRAAVFRVYNCSDVTVRVKAGAGPGAPFSVLQPASGSVTVSHGDNLYVEVRIWLAFTAGAAGVAVPDGAVTFECPESGEEFAFVLKANAISRPTVAVMLALDQSGSMDWAAGTAGATRLEVLKDAARKFMELIQTDNGVGLIRFDNNAYAVNDPTYPGLAVTRITSDNIFDPGRVQAVAAVNAHKTNPQGNTSVGDGVDLARQVLNALPAGDYDQKALIVLTDGLENDPLWISDVTGSINNQTFAIGLGNEQQVNTTALRALANSTGGYLLLTGLLSASIDDYFRLSKYFLQILAGVTNTNIIVDPSGFIAPGTTIRIPFYVNEADIDCTALLMTDENVVDISLEAPDGTLIKPAMAAGLGLSYGVGVQTRHYRFTFPVAIGAGQQAGVWHAVLEVNKGDYKKTLAQLREREDARFRIFATHGARYSVVIHSHSNVKMNVNVEQSSFEPGAQLVMRAALTEYGLPVTHRAQMQVELTRPDASVVILSMSEFEPGRFEVTSQADIAGVYHARIMAKGVTLRGTPFTREQLCSAAVWKGGDQPYHPPVGNGKDDWCRLLSCLLNEKHISHELEERLKRHGIDTDGIRRCIQAYCRHRPHYE